MRFTFVFLCFLACFWTQGGAIYDAQPQIITENGNLVFQTGQNYNIFLKTQGSGKIRLNGADLNSLAQMAQNATALSRRLRATILPWVARSVRNLTREVLGPNGLRRQKQLVDQAMTRIDTLEQGMERVSTLEQQLQTLQNRDTSSQRAQINRRITTIRNRVNTMRGDLRRLRVVLERNECESNPCQHGGTCFDNYNGYFCLCPDSWEGSQCQTDVNECYHFAGTDLGCQHSASCVNKPGSYECICTSGWFGIHCTLRSNDCSSGSEMELCGHGKCVNQHSGASGYTCICDGGWETDGMSPACTVDVDECSQPHPTCSRNPRVQCLNYPGSYHCGNCPSGYTGNGYYCDDIDECLVNNGGCSTNPYVQCINTAGSRACGPCPLGYQGDGYTCSSGGTSNACSINNGGCHPVAICTPNAMIGSSYVTCTCPPGYSGNGVGLQGCISTGGPVSDGCSSHPCVNGQCVSLGSNGYTCNCYYGFTGTTCSISINPCDSTPCLNGGTCIRTGHGYTCSCTGDYYGDRCQEQQQSCTGYFSSPEGTLQFPHSGISDYSHNTNCMWTIVTTIGKILNVTFQNFHLEEAHDCSYDWLSIHDGYDVSGHLIGKFCGQGLPKGGNFNTTHNAMFMWFRSDHSVSGNGFAMTWTTIDPECGGTFQVTRPGAIVSPGYPGRYPVNRDCYWIIHVGAGKRIQLTFGTIQLQPSTDCNHDYVEVRDGSSEAATEYQQICNSSDVQQFTTSGSSAWIHFHSDETGTDTGFHLTYSEVPGVPGCGGLLTQVPGSFSSPGHPDPYQHNMDCEWLIRLQSSDKISLTFLRFDLEAGGPDCRHDFLEVREGLSAEGPLVGRYCGRDFLPPPYRSLGSGLYVRFFTDYSVVGEGFQARYDAACGDVFTASNGTFHSPFYPEAYPRNRDCTYIISQPVGKAVRLDFQFFDIESGWNGCPYDFIEVRDGNSGNSTLIGRYCGDQSNMPAPIISTFNYLWIRFATDGSQQNLGFLANYSTIDVGCGGILTSSRGFITYPESSSPYPHGVECTWIIHVDPGRIIQLSWQAFSLENHARCAFDSVTVSDNSSFPQPGSLIGRFCGNDLPPTLTSTGEIVTVVFKSDESYAAEGFSATYLSFDASTVCSRNYYTETGVLTSPGYPNGYPHNKDCTWVIQVPQGQQILLNITRFDLEQHHDCAYDFLEIRNGGYATSPLVGKYCGTNSSIPRVIPSHSHQMYLHFQSDHSWSGRGFQILWDGTSRGCGGVLNSSRGSLASPNYPAPYGHSAECIWRITVSMGSTIHLTFVDMDFETQQQCYYDYVEVFNDRLSSSSSLGRFCDGSSLISINSTGPTLWVKFRSDYNDNGRGFLARYESSCNRQLRGWNGVIESPNFPHPYPHNRNCTWVIMAPLGNTLNVTFSHFDVEDHMRNNCNYDYLELKESTSLEPTHDIGKYCGGLRPPHHIASTKENVFVTFVSDFSVAHNGFRLEWVVNGCGGIMRRASGEFTSPNYPNLYQTGVDCQWFITVEPGNSIELNITDVDLEGEAECRFDYLDIYGGPDDTAPKLRNLCHGSTTPVTVSSTGNQIFAHFHSDGSLSGRGFRATYTTKLNGCGGRFVGDSGSIHTKNYPSNYGDHDDCAWTIEVIPNHVVELEFKDFDVEPATNCTYDSVTVYDGNDANAPVLMVHCGASLPVPAIVRSTGNTMYVRMKADGSNVAKGFLASYKMGCGGLIYTEESGELTSPLFPAMYPASLNCTWHIVGQRADDHVTLTFTHLDLATDEALNCTEWYVDVRDGTDLDSPLIHRLCGNKVPPAITSQGPALLVHLVSDYWNGGRFRAIYSVLESACGGDYTSDHGTFATPGFPNSYPANIDCVWTIRANGGGRVTLVFQSFDLEQSPYCNNDFVEIHANSAEGPLLGHYCGSEIPTNMTEANVLWIKFRSNGEETGRGFIADFSLMHGNELSGPSGEIYSPQYPYSLSVAGDFTWRITVDQNMAVNLAFRRFYIEGQSGACRATIVVHDGYDDSSRVLLQRCGSEYTLSVTSTSNVVFIKFLNPNPTVGSLFHIHWLQVPPTNAVPPDTSGQSSLDCGEMIRLSSANGTYLTNPGYPEGYDNNLNCEWIVEANVDRRVSVAVIDIQLEMSHNCYYDSLDIYDGVGGQPTWTKLESVCDPVYAPTDLFISSGKFMKLVFRTDVSVNRTGFKVLLQEKCGGNVSATEGFIRSPQYPENYPAQSNCDWVVKVGRGRKIAIEIRSIDVYSSGGACGDDFIMFRNGENIESPLLGSGKYCGTSPQAVPETIGNKLHIRFTSQSSSGQGFLIHFEEVRAACGGSHILSHLVPNVVFTSPNYPNIPNPHTECEWVILAPAGDRIQLDFQQEFKFSPSANCTEDFVEVRDGGTIQGHLLGRFCREMPGTQISSGNALYVRYFTDVTDPQNGFKAQASIAVCGGTIISQNGTISSPNYPSTYGNDLQCVWLLRVPVGHYIYMEFLDINLPGYSNCNLTDSVLLQEKINGTYETLGYYCGSRGVAPLESSSNEVKVTFTSDSNTQISRGFRLHFNASREVCGGVYSAPSAIIQSPGYPHGYAHVRVCTWDITVAEDRRVTLEFLDLDLRPRARENGPCDDYIFVKNSIDPQTGSVMKWSCGSDLPETIESASNEMKVGFRTRGHSTHRGFKARYTSDQPATCGGVVNSTSGWIASPGYENGSYANSLYCKWHFRHPNAFNSSIVFRIPEALLEFCPFDVLRFYGDMSGEQKLLKEVCGNVTQEQIVSSPYAYTTLIFSSDYTITNKGFNLTYQVMPCGSVLVGPYDTIKSPNYPNNYGPNLHCTWVLNYPNGQQIQVKVETFELESTCENDYVEIRNGPSATSPKLGRFCGGHAPRPLFSSASSSLWIEFHSNGATQMKGFQILTEGVTSGCGGLYHDFIGQISSPNYPSLYPNNAECEWEIVIERGYHVILTFIERFDVETSNNCTLDNIQVYDKPDEEWKLIKKLCGKEVPTTSIVAKGHEMKVVFTSNGETNADGFKARWNYTCGETIHDAEGYIISPGYPAAYQDNLTCDYVITTNPNDFVTVEFDPLFEIEAHSSCAYDNITIYEGNSTNGMWMGVYCNTSYPEPLFARGSMFIRFQSDMVVTRRGFRFRYSVMRCGGVYDTEGIISPPRRFRSYENTNCTWVFNAPSGKIVRLKFRNITMMTYNDCQYASVKIYDGSLVAADKLQGTYCGLMDNSLVQIKSKGNVMTVEYFLHRWYGHNQMSFEAAVDFTSECGGTINATDQVQTIRSVDSNGDGNYDQYLDCEWVVVAPAHKTLELQFTSMDIANHGSTSSCPEDFVEIRDGPGMFSSLIGRHCGTTAPPRLHSSMNFMWIQFVSGSTSTNAGFVATVKSVTSLCGTTPLLNATTEVQVFTSPNYPSNYPVNIRCRWVVGYPYVWNNVHLHFVEMDIERSLDCTNDWLEVRDIPHPQRMMATAGHGPVVFTGSGYHPRYDFQWENRTSYVQVLKFCGNKVPADMFSLESNFEVTLVSNGATTGKGFKLEYSMSGCDRTYRNLQGHIYSPNWPAEMWAYAQCTFTIEAPENYTVSVYFNEFSITGDAQCSQKLEIRDGNSTSATLLATYCGTAIPNPVFSTTNALQFRLDISRHPRSRGYDISYTTTDAGRGCGGPFYHTYGTFSSQGYPGNYSQPSDCRWEVEVPGNLWIQLEFEVFSLGSANTCDTDYVEVYGFDVTHTQFLRGRYCGNDRPATYVSETGAAVVHYVTSTSNTGMGWKVKFQGINQGGTAPIATPRP